jgi:hypothetical protein
MDALTIVLLVVIAVVSVVQATFLVRLWLEGRRTTSGLERLADRLVRDMTPAVREVSRAAANTTQLTDTALLEMQRLDAVLQDATDTWSRGTARLHDALVPNIGRVAMAAAAWRLLRRARAVYRRLRG